jgi:DNA-binding XRE family transcriptional regulator
MKKETMPLKKVICKRFKTFRKKIGITQKDLSKRLGIPIKNISTIEVERQLPTLPLILKLMEIHNLSPLWLLSGKGEMCLTVASPETSQMDYFKKAFPEVPADPELIRLIERLSIPILRNSLIVKFYELSETYHDHIEKYEKQKLRELSTPGQQTDSVTGK